MSAQEPYFILNADMTIESHWPDPMPSTVACSPQVLAEQVSRINDLVRYVHKLGGCPRCLGDGVVSFFALHDADKAAWADRHGFPMLVACECARVLLSTQKKQESRREHIDT